MIRAGLTGGIGSGKSTVAGFFADLGAYVQDGDVIAHTVMEPGGAAFDAVVQAFSEKILDADGRISRPLLGELVFQDREALETLNRLVHPRVREESARQIDAYLATGGGAPVMIFEAALLVETGVYKEYDRLIVVKCSRDDQLRRLLKRDQLSVDAAMARISSQLPLEKKLEVADHVIDTSVGLEETRHITTEVYQSLSSEEMTRPCPP
jgi:dephospho-CoA kinase